MYVLSHMYVFPHVKRIFIAKFFSLGNLSLLTNFQKLFTVSNTVSIVAYIFIKRCDVCSTAGLSNLFSVASHKHFMYVTISYCDVTNPLILISFMR